MTVRTKEEIKAALKDRDPIIRDFFLGRISAAERERRLAQLEAASEKIAPRKN